MKSFLDWLDARTGAKQLLHEALYEHIPGGARWRYVWGSTLVFCFFTQVITGFFLWMYYSPSRTTAWESVFAIQHQISGGWPARAASLHRASDGHLAGLSCFASGAGRSLSRAARSEFLARLDFDAPHARTRAYWLSLAVGPKRILGDARGDQLGRRGACCRPADATTRRRR